MFREYFCKFATLPHIINHHAHSRLSFMKVGEQTKTAHVGYVPKCAAKVTMFSDIHKYFSNFFFTFSQCSLFGF